MKNFGTAVILAGGKSTRMGFDKQLLTVHERSLHELVYDALHNVFEDIAVVTNKPALYKGSKLRTFADEFVGMGPLAGIHTALKHSTSKYVYMIACDMPVICVDYVKYMMKLIEESKAQICVTRKNNWIEPFNAFYSVDLLNDSEQRLLNDNTSVFKFISSANAVVIPEEKAQAFDTGLNMFINLNTGSDYLEYLNSI